MGLGFAGPNPLQPQFRGAQSAAMPRLRGAQSAQTLNPKATGAFQHWGRNPLRSPSSETPRRLQHQTSKRPDHFDTKVKAPSPFQLLEPKAHKPKTISPNHRGKTRSSSAFSRRHFGGWQPRFRLLRIQQLPLHQAPEAYRPAPTQEPSRE